VHRICPNPKAWLDVFERLCAHASKNLCAPEYPPPPLILGGWIYSNDSQKKDRWEETVAWAEKNGCSSTVALCDDDFYWVEEITDYRIGPMGGPMYLDWDFTSKARPTRETLNRLIELLRANWTSIAGSGLASVTQPVVFSGRKARCLKVRAYVYAQPPWGTWDCLSADETQRRSFTKLRSSINAALAPHQTDHILFVATDVPPALWSNEAGNCRLRNEASEGSNVRGPADREIWR
jgi:hypothetical protein